MTSNRRPDLRADIPALEPDDVMLAQLASLSAASTATGPARGRSARALLAGGAALVVIGATSWVAGALPGVPSPFDAPGPSSPVPSSSAPTSTSNSSGGEPTTNATPSTVGGQVPTSGASPSGETPGVGPSGTPPAGSPTVPGVGPSAHPTPGKGAQGKGNGKATGTTTPKANKGKHLGQTKPAKPPGASATSSPNPNSTKSPSSNNTKSANPNSTKSPDPSSTKSTGPNANSSKTPTAEPTSKPTGKASK